MFSSALKSFSSNIAANYSINSSPSSISGAWKIYDAKKKSTGKAVSIFVFERKTLEPSSGLSRGSGGSSLRRLHDEVVARIKKEANMLARLRHPSVLELAEPIEDTRSGGLMFATEPITASLAGLLSEQDERERGGGATRKPSRFVMDENDGQQKQRELQIDELEIQKGLLQITQGLEFLHESGGLVHGNLTPEAIYVNVKSDWKIAGFGFAGPPSESATQSNLPPLSLSEALYHEPRLPRSIQLDLDYTSPDFAMDSTVSTAADMFSLGLLLIALYNSPHTSPIHAHANLSTYKKTFSSSSTVPSVNNNFLSSKPLPHDLKATVLPRLITRRPAQRMTARQFQQSSFFDNILVSSIRFLDALPAKTPNEKSQFLRGLPRILDQFPKSVLDKKVLPALLEETKDKDLLPLILQNTFKIVQILPSAERAMSDKILPKLQEIFPSQSTKGAPAEREKAKESGLVVVLDNVSLIGEKCNGREFKEYILPLIVQGLESPVHAIVDKSLGCLRTIIAILDYSSIKNELFPVIASVFSKTSSLGIKVRGLEAFTLLCGGSLDEQEARVEDDFTGVAPAKKEPDQSNASVLDKYTAQEKIVPLLKAIKTKEPAVMMAALAVFRQIGQIADTEFVAMEILPILWSFSLGPLLNLKQFQAFMDLIKAQSARIEQEQATKLKEINSSDTVREGRGADLMNMGMANGSAFGTETDAGELDFESLVLGKKAAPSQNDMLGGFQSSQPKFTPQPQTQNTWQTSAPAAGPTGMGNAPSASVLQAQTRTITPDQSQSLRGFATLNPTSTSSSSNNANSLSSFVPMQPSTSTSTSQGWPAIRPDTSRQSSSSRPLTNTNPQQLQSQFSHANHMGATQPNPQYTNFTLAPPPSANATTTSNSNATGNKGKSGLDAYQSLL